MTDLFKWRHYESEIILTCVRWYLRYALSYRDLKEMMTERGPLVDHSTIFRWVQRYALELDKRSRPQLKSSWNRGFCGCGLQPHDVDGTVWSPEEVSLQTAPTKLVVSWCHQFGRQCSGGGKSRTDEIELSLTGFEALQ